MGLTEYQRKRDFKKTGEPKGAAKKKSVESGKLKFVIQKHDASRLHYDFRLELDGVLKSWAVPKGPSMNPKDKRLAMQVEDHPLEYGDFEGIIPEGEYGGGTVMLWDQGEWEPLDDEADMHKQWTEGSMKFRLKGERLKGAWALVRMKGGDKYGKDNGKSWLVIKERDDKASEVSVTEKYTKSVMTKRGMEEIAAGKLVKEKSSSKSKSDQGQDASVTGGLRVWTGVDQGQDAPATLEVSEVDGARKSKFPEHLKPQLATLVKSAPKGERWVHEIKFDGYRFLAFIRKGKVRLITRNGKDWTAKFSGIAEELAKLPVESAIVDGELVALDGEGVSRFQLLQNSLKGLANPALAFYAFDLVYLDGYSLKGCALEDRKNALRPLMRIFGKKSSVHFSEHFTEPGEKVWTRACEMGLEGIISKDLTAKYAEKRSTAWVKVKCSNRQEFVIGGYTEPTGSRQGFGALLVGFYDEDKKLRYAGKVGTGFTDATLKDLHGRLKKIERKESAFENPPGGSWTRGVHWVKPELVGEVEYMEMTGEGMLRHPSFKGLREDKKARGVTVEVAEEKGKMTKRTKKTKGTKKTGERKTTAQATRRVKEAKTMKVKSTTAKKQASASDDSEVKLTNPQRLLFPDENLTKQDLADYYDAVEERAFPWIANRPITLVRCPAGRSKPCFYQRHNKDYEMPGIAPVDVETKGKKETYIYLAEPVGLRALVQQSTLEIHGWQCRADDVEHPDRMIFDIDPSPEVDWAGVVKAAKKLKVLLEKCGFVTFAMTTGGKGMHIVVPLIPKAGWDEVVGFAEAMARFLETSDPDNYTANMSKKKRTGKVFVDYLRNNVTASAILPYSSRARVGATVATPLRWSEVTGRLDPAKFTIRTVPKRVSGQKNDPWADYEKARVALDYEQVIARLDQAETK